MVEYAFEPMNYILANGLERMARVCFDELENGKYDVNWPLYRLMEKNNSLRFVSLREEGNLIGYATVIIEMNAHKKDEQMGSIGDFYLLPEKRGYAGQFISFIERNLKVIGIKNMIIAEKLNSKKKNRSGYFYKIMGFLPLEMRWVKELK
jgi:hypothetical protein